MDHQHTPEDLGPDGRVIKAWFVVCVSPDTPDGPGTIIGPLPSREMADDEANFGCQLSHLVILGPGSSEATLASASQMMLAVRYWAERPDEVPVACRPRVEYVVNATLHPPPIDAALRRIVVAKTAFDSWDPSDFGRSLTELAKFDTRPSMPTMPIQRDPRDLFPPTF